MFPVFPYSPVPLLPRFHDGLGVSGSGKSRWLHGSGEWYSLLQWRGFPKQLKLLEAAKKLFPTRNCFGRHNFNCQLVLGAINFLSAMEFADPQKGEPPDNFRADDSCGVRELSDAAGDFLC